MKHKPVFLAALCVLLLTGAARAYDFLGVSAAGDTYTVTVQTEADCSLFAALYDESGKMLDLRGQDVTGGADAQPVPVQFDGVPDGGYVRFFLLDSDTFAPLCEPLDSRDVYDGNVYAILYDDGTLVFQHGDTPESGRRVKNTFAVDMKAGYSYDYDNDRATTPWYDERESITCVDFADTIQPKSTTYWFCDCENLAEIVNIGNLKTSNVKYMNGMFRGCANLTALDVSGWDTSNVIYMQDMFRDCGSLTELDVSGWDTSNVTYMFQMFFDCSSLTELDVSKFNTSNVTNISSMFFGCSGLKKLDVSGFDTSNVTRMQQMFFGCSGLTELDVSEFNTSNVTDIAQMFLNCSGLTELDVSDFDTSNVTSMYRMFNGCSGLTELDLHNFDTSHVTIMNDMFYNCAGLKTIYASENFVTDEIEYSSNMFVGCESLVGGNGTEYNRNHIDAEYARIDNPPDAPGYFTRKTA